MHIKSIASKRLFQINKLGGTWQKIIAGGLVGADTNKTLKDVVLCVKHIENSPLHKLDIGDEFNINTDTEFLILF